MTGFTYLTFYTYFLFLHLSFTWTLTQRKKQCLILHNKDVFARLACDFFGFRRTKIEATDMEEALLRFWTCGLLKCELTHLCGIFLFIFWTLQIICPIIVQEFMSRGWINGEGAAEFCLCHSCLSASLCTSAAFCIQANRCRSYVLWCGK